MFLAFLVYFLLLLTLCIGGVKYKHNPRKNYIIGVLLPIIFFSLIIGLRYGVGVDYFSYRDAYLYQGDRDLEPGFNLICSVLNYVGLPPFSLFILCAFLQLFIFTRLTIKYPSIYSWSIYFYFTTLYLFFTINGLRQAIAFSCLVWAISYLFERNFLKYVVIIVLASTIHKSVLIFLPFYFFIHYDILKNRLVLITLYLISIFIGFTFAEYLWILVDLAIINIGIEGLHTETLMNVEWSSDQGRGLGAIFWMLSDLFVILKYPKLKKEYVGYPIVIVFNLYFIGIILEPIIGASYLSRVNIYFVYFRIIMYSFLHNWVFTKSKNQLERVYAFFLVLLFIAFMSNAILIGAGECSPYKFI